MNQASSVVCVCETHEEAQRAMFNLQAAGVDMGLLSIACKDDCPKVHDVDYYNVGDETFSISGIGSILVSGPLASWIVTACNNHTNRGGFSIVGAALATLGIPRSSILHYEAALRSDRYLLIVYGSPDAVASALAAIGGTVQCFHTFHGEKVSDTLPEHRPLSKSALDSQVRRVPAQQSK